MGVGIDSSGKNEFTLGVDYFYTLAWANGGGNFTDVFSYDANISFLNPVWANYSSIYNEGFPVFDHKRDLCFVSISFFLFARLTTKFLEDSLIIVIFCAVNTWISSKFYSLLGAKVG
jgi:hypothetical protein